MITKEVIELCGGKIALQSELNIGTEIAFSFPYQLVKESTETSNETSEIKEIYKFFSGKEILIADDEVLNRMLLVSILSKYQVKLTEVENGIEAVDKVKTGSFDLIIMDIRMPEKNGVEASSEIRKFNTSVPIIAATAVMTDEKKKKCLEAGMNGMIYKPFTEKELLSEISKYFNAGEVYISKQEMMEDKSKINFQALNDQSGDNEVFRKEMATIFKSSINNAAEKIASAVMEKDWQASSDAAHKAMPACKHFDATDLYNALRFFDKLPETVINENLIQEHLIILQHEVSVANEALTLYLQS
ncbi:MAG: response regulator [Bacteroidetes bacterium]|nr:response regulator [Bacteroidota bacterium]